MLRVKPRMNLQGSAGCQDVEVKGDREARDAPSEMEQPSLIGLKGMK